MNKKRKRRRRRPGRPPKPILLPGCNLEYARGAYQADGSFYCTIRPKTRRATVEIAVEMENREAVELLEPCFGTKVGKPRTRISKITGKPYTLHPITRVGKKALELGQKLAVTPYRKTQIQDALKRCQEAWKKGYHDKIP